MATTTQRVGARLGHAAGSDGASWMVYLVGGSSGGSGKRLRDLSSSSTGVLHPSSRGPAEAGPRRITGALAAPRNLWDMFRGGTMHRTRVAVLTVIVAVVLTGFAAAISAASGPVQSPGSLLSGFSSLLRFESRCARPRSCGHGPSRRQGFPAIGAGHIRVVIESDSPLLARTAIEAAGGTVERSWRKLVQADVPASSVAALDRQRSVDSVRAPYRHVEYAVSGEEVTGKPGSGVARQGLYRQGREGGDHRRPARRSRRTSGRRRCARECGHAGLLPWQVRHGVRARHGRGRDRPRDGTGRPAVSDLRRH